MEYFISIFNVNYRVFLIFDRMKRILTAYLLFLLPGATLFSQADTLENLLASRENAIHFRNTLELIAEPATISGTRFFDYHSGIKKTYLFNGDFQVALTVGGPRYHSGEKLRWVHALQFIPSTRVRIFQNDTVFQDKSKPVRTPSYYPRVYYFFSPEKLWNTTNKYNFYFGIGAAHHSNGQDGTEFVDFTDTVNIYNGSFSESLIAQFIVGGRIMLDHKNLDSKQKLDKKRMKRKILVELPTQRNNALNWRLVYEHHPPYFANQKFYDHGVYGGNRLITNFSWISSRHYTTYYRKTGTWAPSGEEQVKESFRLSLIAEYITDLSYNSGGYMHLEKIPLGIMRKRLNVSFTAYKRILDAKFPAIFAQVAYYGSDNYNIYFQKSVFQARVGLAFAFFEYRTLR